MVVVVYLAEKSVNLKNVFFVFVPVKPSFGRTQQSSIEDDLWNCKRLMGATQGFCTVLESLNSQGISVYGWLQAMGVSTRNLKRLANLQMYFQVYFII